MLSLCTVSCDLHSVFCFVCCRSWCNSKCLPVLSCGLEVCPINMSDLRSLDFVVKRFFMKLFNTNVIDTDKPCQDYFDFDLPSVILLKSEERRFGPF